MSDAIQSAILAAFSAALERAISQAVATHVQDLQTRLDDLADRTAQLENQAEVTSNVAAAGVDTQAAPTGDITQHIIDALSDTEHPLFKRMSSFMDAVAEQAMDNHCETYDHDDYDSHVNDDDKHFDGDVGEAVREALDGQSFTISL
jgi:hypothetical protein